MGGLGECDGVLTVPVVLALDGVIQVIDRLCGDLPLRLLPAGGSVQTSLDLCFG